MAARLLAVLVLALAGTLALAPAAGAARNGPIAWAALDSRGPVVVESDSAGGAIRDLLGPSVHDDPLGSGEHVTATLYAGAAGTLHTIAATATNSAGTRKTASITVTAH